MQSLTLRRVLFVFAGLCYVAAIVLILSRLIDLQTIRDGSLKVDRVALVSSTGKDSFLHLEGDGLGSSVRAVLLPEPVGVKRQFSLDDRFGRGLWFDGRFMLASFDNYHLLIIQVDSDKTLRVLASIELPGQITQVTKVGTRALVSLRKKGFWLVDFSAPAKPILVGQVPGVAMAPKSIRDFVVDKQRVYTASRQGRLIMIDMADAEPVARSYPLPKKTWRVALHGSRLATGSLHGTVELFDLDLTGAPHEVGSLTFPDGVRDLGMTDRFLAVTLGNGELHLYDVHSWPHLQRRSILPLGGQPLDLLALPDRSQLLVSRAKQGLLKVDVSDLDHPQVGRNFPLISVVQNVHLANNLLASQSTRNLAVYQLEQVLEGRDTQILPLDGYDHGIFALDDVAYLLPLKKTGLPNSTLGLPTGTLDPVGILRDRTHNQSDTRLARGHDHGRQCLAFSEKRKPHLVHLFCREAGHESLQLQTSLDFETNTTAAFWHENLIYVVTQKRRDGKTGVGFLHIYDAANPAHPLLQAELPLPGSLYKVAWLAPHFVVIAAGEEGLYVVDVADSSKPVLVGSLGLPEHLRKFSRVTNAYVVGQFAYLAHQWNGISQVDLSDPRAPRIVQMIDVPGYVRRMAGQKGFVLASLYREGFFMIDVGDGGEWFPVGRHELPISVADLQACQDNLYVSGGQAGLLTLPLPRRLQVRPLDRRHARVTLPDDLVPGDYRLYLYNGVENLQIASAFQIDAQKAYSIPSQN